MTPFQRTAFASAILSASLLSACGGSSSSSSSSTDEHDHEGAQQLVYTDVNTTDVMHFELEGEAAELIGAAAAIGGKLVLADDGLTAAVITSSRVQFIHSGLEAADEETTEETTAEETTEEEAVEPYLISDANMTTTHDIHMSNNHYAYLNSGNTNFIPAADMAEEIIGEETFSITGATQEFPALMLDEEHELYAAFVDGTMKFYEGTETDSANDVTCGTPTAFIQNGNLALVQCEATNQYIIVTEDAISGEPVITTGEAHTGASIAAATKAGDYILLPTDSAVYLIHADEGSFESEAQSISLTGDQTVCAADLDNDAEALAVIRSDATGEVIDLTGTNATSNITLTEAGTDFTCDDVYLSAGELAFTIVDNSTGYLYQADSHDGAPYHIHTTTELDAGTEVASAVLMVAKEAAAHDHTEE